MNAPREVAKTFLEYWIGPNQSETAIEELSKLLLVEFYRGAMAMEKKMVNNLKDTITAGLGPHYGYPVYIPNGNEETLPGAEIKEE